MERQYVVLCSACSDRHLTFEVEFVDIEEDIQGRDVMHFVCPITHESAKSLVLSK